MSIPSSVLGGSSGVGRPGSDKSLKMGLLETLRQAWADEDIRKRLLFVLLMFGIYCLGVHIPIPIPGIDSASIAKLLEGNQFFNLVNTMGGGAFKRISIFALGLSPYITASIVIQVMTQGIPSWKMEMQEGGEYARKQQNKRTRGLTLLLCVVQGWGLLSAMGSATASVGMLERVGICIFWTAGTMFLLWMGEQMSERGIGNGTSLLIFAGIAISIPSIVQIVSTAMANGTIQWWQVIILILFFLATTWFIVFFSMAQRRIPIQHMRRNFGTKSMGGQTSYLPISVNMAGVIPVIFAISLVYMPAQFSAMFPQNSAPHQFLQGISNFFSPDFSRWQGWIGVIIYTCLIFGFTYLWNALIYNVEDIANNLKKGGSYIPGVRPGKQTIDFLNGIISRVTFVGAVFLAIVALTQYVFPVIAAVNGLTLIGGTSLLILVSVALETMRQIEANLLTKQYGS